MRQAMSCLIHRAILSVATLDIFPLASGVNLSRPTSICSLAFRERRRDRAPAIHVLPDVLRLRQPRLRPPDSAQDAKLEAPLQILPLVSERGQNSCQDWFA